MNALENKHVQKRIREIVSFENSDKDIYKTNEKKTQKTIEERNKIILSLKNEKEKLRHSIDNKNDEIQILKETLNDVERKHKKEISELKEIYQEKISKLENQNMILQYYVERYGEIEKYYELYLSLEEEIHNDLKRVLRIESVEMFFSSGVQLNNIEALWSYIAGKLNVFEEATLDKLRELFDYLFSIYIKIDSKYERQVVKIGDEFDEEFHSRMGGTVAGNVKQILLLGYRNIYTNYGKKSIVVAERRNG